MGLRLRIPRRFPSSYLRSPNVYKRHTSMCTVSLLEVNRRAEEQRRLHRIAKIHEDLAKAAQESMTLKQRYQMAAETMKRQLHALRIDLMSVQRPMAPYDTLTVSPSSKSRSRAGSRAMSITAPVFMPSMASESSTDTESSERSSSSQTSDSEEVASGICIVDSDGSEDSQEVLAAQEYRKKLLGKIVSGRLNVYTPKSGETRYYLNWSKNTHDNVLLAPELMEATFGSLDGVKTGMYLQATISDVPTDLKEHPFGNDVFEVPSPKSAGKKRRKRRQKRYRSRAPTLSNE